MFNKKAMSFLLVAIIIIQVSVPALASSNSNEIIELTEKEIKILEDEVPNLDINKMNSSEKLNFYKIIDERVEEEAEYERSIGNNDFDKELFKEELIQLFDGSDGISLYSIHVPISNRLVAAGIDVAISALVGGVVGGVQGFIKQKGATAARKIFSATIKDRLIAWGAVKLGAAVGVITNFVMSYLDYSTRAAEWLNRNDRDGKNGYWDLYIF